MLCWIERKEEEAPGGDPNNKTAPPPALLLLVVPSPSMTTGLHTLFHDFPSNLSIVRSLSFLPLLKEIKVICEVSCASNVIGISLLLMKN